MYCIHCGKENEGEGGRCAYCGQPLNDRTMMVEVLDTPLPKADEPASEGVEASGAASAASYPAAQSGKPVSPGRPPDARQQAFCIHCGTRLFPGVLFCPTCGNRVDASAGGESVDGGGAAASQATSVQTPAIQSQPSVPVAASAVQGQARVQPQQYVQASQRGQAQQHVQAPAAQVAQESPAKMSTGYKVLIGILSVVLVALVGVAVFLAVQLFS